MGGVNCGCPHGGGNANVKWYYSNTKQYPIKVVYNGKTTMVLPYRPDGSRSPKIKMDYTYGEPRIKGGTLAR